MPPQSMTIKPISSAGGSPFLNTSMEGQPVSSLRRSTTGDGSPVMYAIFSPDLA
nr:Uncharacterised protein [Klebsiella pneumoniae]